MTQDEYIQQFSRILTQMLDLTKAKNSDYADSTDAFHNFKQIEQLSSGRISVASGILVRMTDKMTRIANLLSREAQISEKLEDTLTDLAVYSIILRIWLEEKANRKS